MAVTLRGGIMGVLVMPPLPSGPWPKEEPKNPEPRRETEEEEPKADPDREGKG